VLEAWYRAQIRARTPELLARWEATLGVRAGKMMVQRMRTRWGGCNPSTGVIRLNTDLARKPPECLEYILVHELAHLLEPTHNARFQGLMDHFLPDWRMRRQVLNGLPLRHDEWAY
jgi:predicted metal-dependent hydrolase